MSAFDCNGSLQAASGQQQLNQPYQITPDSLSPRNDSPCAVSHPSHIPDGFGAACLVAVSDLDQWNWYVQLTAKIPPLPCKLTSQGAYRAYVINPWEAMKFCQKG